MQQIPSVPNFAGMPLTLRQRILKWVYPLFLVYKKLAGSGQNRNKHIQGPPKVSFYSLSAELNSGEKLLFEQLRGKKLIIVNTASNCGYTPQYSELQKLYEHSKEALLILAFPSNDFKEQEKGSDAEIARFCKVNFGVSFPLAKKTIVKKHPQQNRVFEWLSHKELNGWNDKEPSWNFSKYLIDENGNLTHCFDPAVSPLSEEVMKAIHE